MNDALKSVQVLSRSGIWLGFFIVLAFASQLAQAGRFGTERQ